MSFEGLLIRFRPTPIIAFQTLIPEWQFMDLQKLRRHMKSLSKNKPLSTLTGDASCNLFAYV